MPKLNIFNLVSMQSSFDIVDANFYMFYDRVASDNLEKFAGKELIYGH